MIYKCNMFTVCISTRIDVIWLEWENNFKLLKKIHTVSSIFNVNGSMLYISIKKNYQFLFYGRHFSLSTLYFLFFYNIR